MTQITDDLLCAYIDGEADADTVAQIQARLAIDADLRERLEQLVAGDKTLRNAFPLGSTPADDALVSRLNAPAPVTPMTGRVRATSTTWIAMAAAVAGLAFGLAVAPRAGSSNGTRQLAVLPPALVTALERVRSGAQEGNATLVMSFRSETGELCRVFADAPYEGIACRDDQSWRLVALAATRSDGGYRPASGASALDSALAAMGAQPPLSADEEARLIAGGWR